MIATMVAHLWQSTLFVALAWLMTLALRTNRAQVRYWIWFVASVKFLLPFSLLVGIGAFLPHRSTALPLRPEWVAVIQQIDPPPPRHTESASLAIQTTNPDYAASAALLLWACGFTTVAAFWFVRWRRIRALQSSARSVTLQTALHIPVPVMVAADLTEPGVVGIFRQVLFLPDGISERLTPIQLDAILAHEICHVRRRDNLTASIHMAVQATFWFHPMTWWIGSRLLDEREKACDEEVLRHGCKPSLYAESILVVCKSYLSSPLPCVSGVTGSSLTRRIEAIMRNRILVGLNPAKKLVLAVVGLMIFAMPIVIGALNAPAIHAQGPLPQFEVASLRLNNGCENTPRSGNLSPSPGRLEMPCVTLRSMIQSAYGTFRDGISINSQPVLVEGGASWMNSEHYILSAKADGPTRTEMLAGPMLRTFLEERFQLKTHHETRELPVYAMTVEKSGIKTRPIAEGTCIPLDLTHAPALPKPGEPRPAFCGALFMGFAGPGKRMMELRGSTMTQFAQRLSGLVDRNVVDNTGVAGNFDFHLEFVPDLNMSRQILPIPSQADARSTAPIPDSGPNLFAALQEQLGLKLSSSKGSVSILVIDHMEKPAAN